MVGHPDWTRWRVAITGMNAVPDNPGPGVAVARCLREGKRFTGEIVGLGYDVLDPGLYAGGPAYLLPYPSSGAAALLERLREIHRRTPLDAIIPCLDSELNSFLQIEDSLGRLGIRLLLPSLAALRGRSKHNLSELCEKLNIHHPRTQAVLNSNFFQRCEDDGWRYPLVVKGAFYGATVAHSPAEARLAFERIANEWGYPVLAQEHIPGGEVNLTALGDGRGRMLGSVAMRKQAVTDKGKAWAGVTIIDEELTLMAERLIKELEWAGPLELEVMKGHEGRLSVIEINPRFPAWVSLTLAVERNLPEALLALMAGETTFLFPRARAGKMFVRFAQEMLVDVGDLESLVMGGSLGESTQIERRSA